MIHRICREWRKVSLLSATFLFSIFFLFSCKKKESPLGNSAFDPSELLKAGAIDTFTINTYTVLEDSIPTKNVNYNLLGEFNDPVFGKIDASFYTQIRLATPNPVFGDLSTIVIDSFVLAMKHSDYTGSNTTQTFEVYELNEDISSDTNVIYYDFSSLTTKPTNLVMPGKGTFKPNPIGNVVIDTISYAPQMRLFLDTNLARDFMEEAVSGTSFSSNDNFLNYFKGLFIKANNPPQAANQGGVFSFDMNASDSKLTIYYRKFEIVNGVPTPFKKTYDFVINTNSQSFNHVEINRAGTKVQQALSNQAYGAQEFYAQSFGLKGIIEIPGLSQVPKNAIIHKAVLNLPYQYQTGSIFSPGFAVFVGDNVVSTFLNAQELNEITKSITTDIRSFVQDIVTDKRENNPLYISTGRNSSGMDRIIFNGRNSMNKLKPKLYIIYTEF